MRKEKRAGGSILVTLVLGLLLTVLGLAAYAFAQGCSQCGITARQGVQNPQAMNLAILVLLIPTLAIFVGILIWAFRRRRLSPSSPEPESWALPLGGEGSWREAESDPKAHP